MATYASQIGTTISKRMSDEPSFKEAYAEHRAKWLKGEAPPTFTWNDKKYSVATREEAARQKEMMESPMRGRGYGQRAESRAEIPTGPSKAPAERGERMSPLEMGLLTTAGALAGPAVGRGAMAAYRGAKSTADAVRGAVQASRGLEEARRARLAREMDDSLPEPAGIPELGRGVWRSAREKAEAEARKAKPRVQVEGTKGGVYRGAKDEKAAEAKPEFRSRTADRMDEREMGMKKGGKVKTYASGGSVKGSGCERRGLRPCKVY